MKVKDGKVTITFTFDKSGKLVDVETDKKDTLWWIDWVAVAHDVKIDRKVMEECYEYIRSSPLCNPDEYCSCADRRFHILIEKQENIPLKLAKSLYEGYEEWNYEYNDDSEFLDDFKEELLKRLTEPEQLMWEMEDNE